MHIVLSFLLKSHSLGSIFCQHTILAFKHTCVPVKNADHISNQLRHWSIYKTSSLPQTFKITYCMEVKKIFPYAQTNVIHENWNLIIFSTKCCLLSRFEKFKFHCTVNKRNEWKINIDSMSTLCINQIQFIDCVLLFSCPLTNYLISPIWIQLYYHYHYQYYLFFFFGGGGLAEIWGKLCKKIL